MSLQRGSNYVEMKEDAAVLEAKRRRYLSSPLSECSDPAGSMDAAEPP